MGPEKKQHPEAHFTPLVLNYRKEFFASEASGKFFKIAET